MTELSTIKISEKVYVGFQGREDEDDKPLGFLTPYDDTQAGIKRRSTVDSWASGRGGNDKTFNSVTIDNVPMVGFSVGRAIRRTSSWSGKTSRVRIQDPRGFELEISVENMIMIMANNLIDDGIIQEECIWGREGSENILLPINSEPYINYLRTKKLVTEAISLRSVNPGDHITLITGESGMYCGSLYPVTYDKYSTGGMIVGKNKRYVIGVEQEGSVVYKGFTSIKVSSVNSRIPAKLTPTLIEQHIIDGVANKDHVLDTHDYSQVLAWVHGTDVTFNMRLIPITEEIAKENRETPVIVIGKNRDIIIVQSSYFDKNFLQDRKASSRKFIKLHEDRTWHSTKTRIDEIPCTGFIGPQGYVSNCSVSVRRTEERWVDGQYRREEFNIQEDDVQSINHTVIEITTSLGNHLSKTIDSRFVSTC